MPTGLGDIFESGMSTLDSLLGIGGDIQYIFYAVLAVVGICLLAIVLTGCWSVGSGQTNINDLAKSVL